jgi:hypothetical protein
MSLPTPKSTEGKKPDVSLEDATTASLSKEIIELRNELADQQKENRNFIKWIIGGVVVIVAVVGIEVMLFHTRSDADVINLQNQYFQQITDVRQELDNLRPYCQIQNTKYAN